MTDHSSLKGERACDLAAKMARALSDLHAFAAIEAITEHSLFSPDSHAAEQRIRSICQREMRRCVRAHDRAAAALQAAETRAQQAEARVEVERGRASGLLEAAWEAVAQLGSGDNTAELLAEAILKHDGDPDYALDELAGMGFAAARQALGASHG